MKIIWFACVIRIFTDKNENFGHTFVRGYFFTFFLFCKSSYFDQHEGCFKVMYTAFKFASLTHHHADHGRFGQSNSCCLDSSDEIGKSLLDNDLSFQEMLNHCFDDIELFMGRLQEVADSYKELERRRDARKKKKPVPGGLEFISFLLATVDCWCWRLLNHRDILLNARGPTDQCLTFWQAWPVRRLSPESRWPNAHKIVL